MILWMNNEKNLIPMQETRRQILEVIRYHQEATVNEITKTLSELRGGITSVTIRHHLNILQEEQLIYTVQLRHRNSPGRPQHVYRLTDKALSFLPSNYQRLATGLLHQLEQHLPKQQVNVILDGVALEMAQEAAIPNGPMPKRLDAVVVYLCQHGYEAKWEEKEAGGFLLHTFNCPYHHVAQQDSTLCQMDMRLISTMLGIVPRLVSRISSGESSCTYFIPHKADE